MGQKTTWLVISILIILILALVGIGSYFLGKQNVPKLSPTLYPTAVATPIETITPAPIATETPSASKSPSPTPSPIVFQITSVTASVNPNNAVACSPSTQTFNFKGAITANSAGSVSYQWERSDGASAPVQTAAFLAAGSQEVTTTWTLSRNSGQTYNGWQRVKIISPNPITSSQANFTVSCP